MAESRSMFDFRLDGEINWEGVKGAHFGERNNLYLGCGDSYTVFILVQSQKIYT